MNEVICPNCCAVVPPWPVCLNCNTSLLTEAPIDRAVPSVSAQEAGSEDSRQMDPHLSRARRRLQTQGVRKLATASTSKDEVAVIAKVDDVDAFRKLDHVRVFTIISSPRKDSIKLVTARMPGAEIEEVRGKSFVKSLKLSRRLRPALEQTVEETRVVPPQSEGSNSLQPVQLTNGGKGVIVGIVDFGLDFTHKNFRHKNGKSRILALWDQTAQPIPKARRGVKYGRVYTKREINKALQAANPEEAFKALGYAPSRDSLFDTGAHGTYVADVAAGNGRGTNRAGIAPEADIVFVEAATTATPNAVGSTFGDSAQLLEAIQFIFGFAEKKGRPCVINLSLGTNDGPHDGSTLVETAIDWLLEETPGRAVVIAAGNSFNQDIHAAGTVPQGGSVDLKLFVPPFDASSNELELWYSGKDRFAIQVLDPDGNLLTKAPIEPGHQGIIPTKDQGRVLIVNRLDDPNNQDNTISVFFERGAEFLRAGNWTLRLLGRTVRDGKFHAWIERDQTGQSRFMPPGDGSYQLSGDCTLGSIACGEHTIVVGSYDAHRNGLPLSDTSSAGPTRLDRLKPEVSAPGEGVLAARSRTEVLRHRQSGTSMAAAAVTGIVALMLAQARLQGRSLDAEKIRQILIETARPGTGWHPRHGYGRVNAAGAIAKIAPKPGPDTRGPSPLQPEQRP